VAGKSTAKTGEHLPVSPEVSPKASDQLDANYGFSAPDVLQPKRSTPPVETPMLADDVLSGVSAGAPAAKKPAAKKKVR